MTRHGYSGYANGCRCDVCSDAKAAYMRERRATASAARRKVEAGGGRFVAPIPTHGYAGYQDAHCRCHVCRKAKAAVDQLRCLPRREEADPR